MFFTQKYHKETTKLLTKRSKKEVSKSSKKVVTKSSKREDNKEDKYKINESIFCVRLGQLIEKEPLQTLTFDDMDHKGSVCKECGLFRNSLSKISRNSIWKCENCSTVVILDENTAPKITGHDIEYIRNEQSNAVIPLFIIFCIDVSGSMHGPRLDKVKENLKNFLDFLIENDMGDNVRVAITLFNDKGYAYVYENNMELVLKNIATELDINRTKFENNQYNANQLADYFNRIPSLTDSYSTLSAIIDQLEAGGCTFMGEALVFSTLLGSASIGEVDIILCTDGETHDSNREELFDNISRFALSDPTRIIRIYSSKLDECQMKDFESISRRTNGKCETFLNIMDTVKTKLVSTNKRAAQLRLINQLVVMGNKKLIGLKTLFNNQVINEKLQNKSSSKIVLDDYSRFSIKEMFIEITLLKTPIQPTKFFFQVQFHLPNVVRVITRALSMLKREELRKNAMNPPKNEILIYLNTWRHLAYYLLEKKDFEEAVKVYKSNKTNLRTDIFDDDELDALLKNELFANLDNFSGLPFNISDKIVIMLSNSMNRALEDHKNIDLDEVDDLPKERSPWKPSPAGGSTPRPPNTSRLRSTNRDQSSGRYGDWYSDKPSSVPLPYLPNGPGAPDRPPEKKTEEKPAIKLPPINPPNTTNTANQLSEGIKS